MSGMDKESDSSKPNPDIILWLLAAALAVVLFLAEKTSFWTSLFLIALLALLVHPVIQIPWVRTSGRRQFAALALLIGLVTCFGWVTWPNANRSFWLISNNAFTSVGLSLLKLLRDRRIQDLSCGVLGMLLLKLIQSSTRWVSYSRKNRKHGFTGAKGFLDYKMQAEEGMQRLSPVLSEITKIMSEVDSGIAAHLMKIEVASNSPARMQLEVVRKTAVVLDRHSRRLDKECSDLEEIGDSLTEGIEEWLKWVSHQPTGWQVKEELELLLKSMVNTLSTTLEQTNLYLQVLQSTSGVSRDWNEAVDSHHRSITRVRDVSEKIRESCMSCLRFFELTQPPLTIGLPSSKGDVDESKE